MHWLWVLIVGAVIGTIAGAITNRGAAMGWITVSPNLAHHW